MPSSLERKNSVVISGVSSGIGNATAKLLTDNGYQVFGSVRCADAAERLQQELKPNFHALIFDVMDRAAIGVASAKVCQALNGQPLAALINNAGLGLFGPIEDLDDLAFEAVVGVNLFGTRNVTNAFLPLLRSSPLAGERSDEAALAPGKIINISSLSGILNTPMNGAYCISKHAMESLGEIYRRELLSFGIDVVSIRSGPIQSEIWEKNLQSKLTHSNPDYAIMAANAKAIMRDAQSAALPATFIAELILDIIEGRKRRTAYEVGKGAVISKILSSLVPKRLVDRLIDRALRKSAG